MKAWSRSDIISAIAAGVAVLGFFVVIWQVHIATVELEQAQLHQRTQLLADLHDRLVNSSENGEIFQRIEYGKLTFDGNFHNSRDQRKLVRLLSHLELIARLEDLDLLRFSDVSELFGYYMVRIYNSKVFEEYTEMLKSRSAAAGLPGDITFPRFSKLARRTEKEVTKDAKHHLSGESR